MTSSTQMNTEKSGHGSVEIACHRLIYLFCSGIWSYISCCDVFSSYPHVTSGSCHFRLMSAVSHFQSYTHAALHVGFTQDRDSSMRMGHLPSNLPHHGSNHWGMVGCWCVTRVIQSCMSNHMCLVFTMVTCSRVYCFSHCSHVLSFFRHGAVCHFARAVFPLHQLHALEPTALL